MFFFHSFNYMIVNDNQLWVVINDIEILEMPAWKMTRRAGMHSNILRCKIKLQLVWRDCAADAETYISSTYPETLEIPWILHQGECCGARESFVGQVPCRQGLLQLEAGHNSSRFYVRYCIVRVLPEWVSLASPPLTSVRSALSGADLPAELLGEENDIMRHETNKNTI